MNHVSVRFTSKDNFNINDSNGADVQTKNANNSDEFFSQGSFELADLLSSLFPQGSAEAKMVDELKSRVSSKEFYDILDQEHNALNDWQQGKEEAQQARETHRKIASHTPKDEMSLSEAFHNMKKAVDNERELYAQYLRAYSVVDEYKNASAALAAKVSDSLSRKEITDDVLGDAVKTVSFPSNSREWLEQRQKGVGGSDVGAILGVDDTWSDRNYEKVLSSKVNEITDEDVHDRLKNNGSFIGFAGRGDAWEEVIVNIFAHNNPGYEVLHTKDSWVNKDRSWQFANLDGVLLNKETQELGVLEIKTASNAAKWDDGVPVSYRAQVLHYLNATGFTYAYVAVVIDDQEYRQYRINKGDVIVPGNHVLGTYVDNVARLEAFFHQVQAKRQQSAGSVSQGIKKGSLKRSVKSYFNMSRDSSREIIIRHLAAYTGEDKSVVAQRLDSQKPWSRKDDHNIICAEYSRFDPVKRGKDIVAIDLETSSFSPAKGEIIEIGIFRVSPTGEIVDQYEHLFNVDPDIAHVKGTGASHIHGITLEDVAGKPSFRDPLVQRRVSEILGIGSSDTVILAHNVSFERNWLNQYLNGFHDAEIPCIDTMYLARYFDHDSENNKLESFCGSYGVDYVNAHRAFADAEMTYRAFDAFQKSLRDM